MPSDDALVEPEDDDLAALIARLADTDRVTRLVAISDLGDLRNAKAVGPLVRCLQAGDEIAQTGALKALAKIGDLSVLPVVHEAATGNESFAVRSTAAETLATLGDARGMDLLLAMLSEPGNPSPQSYRRWLARFAVELRATEATPEFIAARSGARPLVRWRLSRAIRTLKKLD